MKRILIRIPSLVLLAVSLMAQAEIAKVADVSANPKKYDGKTITTEGAVAGFKEKTSKRGLPYTTFTLVGPKNEKVHVWIKGKLPKPPKEGDKVVVTGKYAAEKKVGTLVFKNEIDATPGTGQNGVKPATPIKPAGPKKPAPPKPGVGKKKASA